MDAGSPVPQLEPTPAGQSPVLHKKENQTSAMCKVADMN